MVRYPYRLRQKGRVRVGAPFLRIEDSGEVILLRDDVTTAGRGQGCDIRLDDPSVSRLHAELVRRGPYVYVVDLGLSRNGTRVNGRPVARRVLDEGDVLSFGAARGRIGGIPQDEITTDLVVTEAAVKQHLLRLYQKFRIPEGPNRRTRLANEVVALGLVKPMPPADTGEQLKMGVPEQPVRGRHDQVVQAG